MNAKQTIENLRNISEYMMRASHHPHFYNTETSQYLEKLSHMLYSDAYNLESLNFVYGLPQLDEVA